MTIRDEALEYVSEHGRYMRDNCYVVRFPTPSGGKCIVAEDTFVLVEKVATEMRRARRKQS
jgi:hypothetical protein